MIITPRRLRMTLLAIAIGSWTASHSWAGPTFTYRSFDPPAGDQSPVGVSIASGISNNGAIIGTYYTADSTAHGYILNQSVYTYFDAPGAGTGNFDGTNGVSINSAGQAIVTAFDNSGHETSYLYSGGSFTAINDPLAGSSGTVVSSINDNGIITGNYGDGASTHPFQYDIATRTFSALPDVPGSFGTSAQVTETNGDVLVYYLDDNLHAHIALDHGGVFSFLPDAPGATSTFPLGINSSGAISGYYFDASFNYHGFEYLDGTYYTTDYPDAAGTTLGGINDAGQAVGYWFEPSGEIHSLLVTASVPEPSTLVMYGIAGAVGLGLARVRRKRG